MNIFTSISLVAPGKRSNSGSFWSFTARIMLFTSVSEGKKASARSRYSSSSGATEPSDVIAPQIA